MMIGRVLKAIPITQTKISQKNETQHCHRGKIETFLFSSCFFVRNTHSYIKIDANHHHRRSAIRVIAYLGLNDVSAS